MYYTPGRNLRFYSQLMMMIGFLTGISISAASMRFLFARCAALILPCVLADREAWMSESHAVHTNSCDIGTALAARLSEHAKLVLPGNDSFHAFEIRAASPRIQPTFTAIVEPATEADVQHTVWSTQPRLNKTC